MMSEGSSDPFRGLDVSPFGLEKHRQTGPLLSEPFYRFPEEQLGRVFDWTQVRDEVGL